MAENNSSAPLKTARFPGEGGHSWTLSLNQLRGLIAELQNQLDSYEEDPDLEVQLVLSFVHPGLVKDEEDGTTNNVPLLTLHDAEYPEEGVYPINPLDCHAGVTIPPQAVAAQAAPAAVAVTEAQIDAILDEPAGMIFHVSDQRHKQHLFARRVLALATPALPATEDSSAGDKKVEWEHWEEMRHSANEWADMATSGLQWLRNIVDSISDPKVALENMEQNLAHCRKVDEAIKAPNIKAQAEVQAEPVYQITQPFPSDPASTWRDASRDAFDLTHPGKRRVLYTAPQAQPADALERDVRTALQMLQDREWAENFAKSDLGKQLESAITDLHSEIHEAHESDDAEVAAMAAAQEGGHAAKEA